MMKALAKRMPRVGMRIIKSCVGVLLGFLIYFLRGQHGTPFYTALSVLWCMRPHTEEMKTMAIQRSIGTFIGGLYGLVLLLMTTYSPLGDMPFMTYCIIALFIVPIIYTTLVIKRKNASYFACVVFLSVTVIHMEDSNPYLFVLNRVVDTLIGIFVALAVNSFRLPCRKQEDVLFVSGMDDALLTHANTMSDYSRVELNRMLDDGAKFTVATMRTPATLVENLRGIRIQLPVIAMDGAAIFDIRDNRYLKTIPIQNACAHRLADWLEAKGLSAFANVIHDDRWEIYYDELQNKAQKAIYQKLRRSPYRNYMRESVPANRSVLYFLLVEKEDVVRRVYEYLSAQDWMERCQMTILPDTDYPNYRQLRICNARATRENMIQELADMLELKKTVVFSSEAPTADILVKNPDSNQVVKQLKRLYEPYIWERRANVF